MGNAARATSETFAGFQPVHSPLFMVMRDPVLHQFISYLTEKKRQQERAPGSHVTIELSRSFIEKVRESFKADILAGELHLHILSHILASYLLEGDCELHSNVIGDLPGEGQRPFLIRERITREILFSETDLDLGNQLLRNFRYHAGNSWSPLVLSANFVEYIPRHRPSTGVNRLTSRVKAEEELWNKVADEIFNLDELVQLDKHLQHFSKYIKDIFGIKIVCEDEATCLSVHERLRGLDIGQCDRRILESLPSAPHGWDRTRDRLLEFIETKNYLTCEPEKMKKTGWKAMKSVVRWNEQLFEIQVQPLTNYYFELDDMSGPSHRSFKTVRESLREEIASRIPLYGFYRDLLKMLFMGAEVSFVHKNASVVLKEE